MGGMSRDGQSRSRLKIGIGICQDPDPDFVVGIGMLLNPEDRDEKSGKVGINLDFSRRFSA